MIRVTIEMIPQGIEEKRETLASVQIVNTMNHPLPGWGNYEVRITQGDVGENFEIKSHLRSDGLWKLLKRVFAWVELSRVVVAVPMSKSEMKRLRMQEGKK
jgi:hypothetical protein